MKKKIILLVALAIVCIMGLGACSDNANIADENEEISADQLQEANADCINVETHNVVMQTNTEGVVKATVQLPDYEKLYKEAYNSENPDQYLWKCLKSDKYDVCEYEITAKVTIENGEEVIHTDEAIKELLEKVLSDAADALMEAK